MGVVATLRPIRLIMLSWLMTSCLLGFALANTQEYQLCYQGTNGGDSSCMKVELNKTFQMVHYHMPESGDFMDVETLEDYNEGLAASRVESQEACYVRRLVKSFDDQVTFIASHNDDGMRVKDQVQVSAVSLDNPVEEIGSVLTDFCGDLPVYKLVKEEESEEGEERDLDRRQVNVTFTKCLLLFFIPVCASTTLTLATGSTITFGWFFFG